MAYNLVLNTKFNPFTYDEMIKPIEAATKAHQALEEEYGNYQQATGIWENRINQDVDPELYAIYRAYMDDLEGQVDQLSREGLSPLSRRQLINMKSRFGQEILPIEQAYNRRQTLADKQDELRARDNTLRFERDMATTRLYDFYKNPTLSYGRSYSGDLLRKQVQDMVRAYSKQITSTGKLEGVGLPFQYQRKNNRGAQEEDVLGVIYNLAELGDMEAKIFLSSIVDQAMQASGVEEWAPKGTATYNELRSFANMGLYDAIGEPSIQQFTDSYGAQSYGQGVNDRLNRMLPINSVRLLGNNKVGKQANMEASDFARKLGLRSSLNGGWQRIQSATLQGSGSAVAVGPSGLVGSKYKFESGDGSFTIFNRNGDLVSRQAVVNQGTNDTEREFLGNYYDEVLKTWNDYFGADPNTNRYNAGYLSQQLRQIDTEASPLALSAVEINFGSSNNKEVLSTLVSRASQGDSGSVAKIKKITSWDRNGNNTLGDSFDAGIIDDDSNPLFYVTGSENTGGLMMKYKGEYYLIPYSVIGGISENAARANIPLLQKLNTQRQQLIDKYGPDRYITSKEGQRIEEMIDQAGGTLIRNMSLGLGLEYKQPRASLMTGQISE